MGLKDLFKKRQQEPEHELTPEEAEAKRKAEEQEEQDVSTITTAS